jgi:hypothetical protein
MMKKMIPLLILAATCTASASDWKRPYVVHGDDQSCLYTFLNNTTKVTCDKSATHIEDLRKEEDAWIDKQEAREEGVLQESRERHAATERKQEKERQERIAAMVAHSPKGWACVIKRLPPGTDLLSMDYKSPLLDKCSKEFDADDVKPKKTKKK